MSAKTAVLPGAPFAVCALALTGISALAGPGAPGPAAAVHPAAVANDAGPESAGGS